MICMGPLYQIITIHHGAFILPFLNYPDVLIFMRCSRACYRNFLLWNQPFSFYGLPLPISKGIWSDLFYQRYASLEQGLKSDHDKSPDEFPLFHGRFEVTYKLYHGLTLMEIAYMLRDTKAIQLLKRYNRSTVHNLYSFSTQYGQHAHALLVAYSEHAIKNQLQDQKQYNLFMNMGQYSCE